MIADDLRITENSGTPAKPVSWRIYAALVLLALLPRAAMAIKVDTICHDAMYYMQAGRDYETGDPKQRLAAQHFNAFIAVGRVLHAGGLDWYTAYRALNLIAATLLVLPVFGWLRRQFNDRVAFAACVLLAFHPKMIEWSTEIVREPLFLLAFATALYGFWRGIDESRKLWFVVGGLAASLAIQTRFEGWFVLVPLACWTWQRGWRFPAERRSLVIGNLLAAATFPLFLVAMNLVLHPSFDKFELGANLHRLVYLTDPDMQAPLSAGIVEDTAAAVSPRKIPPRGTMFLRTVTRGYTPLWGLLAILGVIRSWRSLLRPDVRVLSYVIVLMFAAIWVHMQNAPESSSRYILLPVLMSLPAMTCGLGVLTALAERGLREMQRATLTPSVTAQFAIATSMAVVVVAGSLDAMLSRDHGRTPEATLGAWMRSEWGVGRVIAGPMKLRRLAHYSDAEFLAMPPSADIDKLASFAAEEHADFVAIPAGQTPEQVAQFRAALEARGYTIVENDQLPANAAHPALLAVHRRLIDLRTARR